MKNVALFGAGRIGRIHGSNIAALPGVKLKYVCDPFGDSAAQLAARNATVTFAPSSFLVWGRPLLGRQLDNFVCLTYK